MRILGSIAAVNTALEATLLGPYSGTCAIFRAEDGPEVFLIFTSRHYSRFCAFIVCFRAYIVRILSSIAAVSR